MHYILITELESVGSISCIIKGLPASELNSLESALAHLNILSKKLEDSFEVDIEGVQILNMLSAATYNYRVYGQSMVIEVTNIGGRGIKIQKTRWTLGKELVKEK